jgi:hypothetical protein
MDHAKASTNRGGRPLKYYTREQAIAARNAAVVRYRLRKRAREHASRTGQPLNKELRIIFEGQPKS